MFAKGSFVISSSNGVCEIRDIVKMNMTGVEKEYYVLLPVEDEKAKVFLSIDTAEKRVRSVMTKEEAWKLIKEIKAVDETLIKNEREREKFYKEAINSRDPKQWISIMKTLYIRREKRLEEGKKSTSMDERYFKLAENQLHGELAFSLGVEKSDVRRMIEENIE